MLKEKEELEATADITIDDFVSLKDEYRKEYVYNLFSTPDSHIKIKKLFLLLKSKQLFDNELLGSGLLSAIIHKQDQYIDLILNFTNNNKTVFNSYQQNVLFNSAFKNKNQKIIEYFDTNYSIAKNLDKKSHLELINIDAKGKFNYSGAFCDGYPDEIFKGNYLETYLSFNKDPLNFSVHSKNEVMFNWLLEKNNNHINPELIEEIFIDLTSFHKKESLLFLINQKASREIIEKSDLIDLFLSEKTQFLDIKFEVKKVLNKPNKTSFKI